jgi:glycosyltransferase involved in cell wall biosynthesis
MKLLCLTLKRFAKVNADTSYVSNIAVEFSRLLGDKFVLTMSGKPTEQIKSVRNINLRSLEFLIYIKLPRVFYRPLFSLTYVLFFFHFPFFILNKGINQPEQIIFSSDPNLLVTAIFWKRILGYRYRICSDWHMLHGNWKDKYIAKNSDQLISTSQKLKKIIAISFDVPESKMLVAYGGIDLEKYGNLSKEQAREKLGLPQDKKLVGYIGLFTTLRMEKGIGTMVRSLKYLNDDINIVLVGRREREGVDYDQLAVEEGVKEKCVIRDFVDYEKMIIYEQAMDILVIPYPDQPHFRNYGFPMKAYEYMASQRPIIYSRLELAEEVLADCAFSFSPDDPCDLAKEINFVLATESVASVHEKVNRAYEKVSDFSWSKKAAKIIEFLIK